MILYMQGSGYSCNV